MSDNIVPLDQLGMDDVPRVGGKNASLGEMIKNLGSLGVEVPGGFATTANAFDRFLDEAGIRERIHARLDQLDTDDVNQLAIVGKEIRSWITDSTLPADLQAEITDAYGAMAVYG
jgi:pyruvate,water dikinase